MKLVFSTQYLENYNVSGEGPDYWKPKGGDYYVMDVSVSDVMGEKLFDLVKTIIPFITWTNEGSISDVVSWNLYDDSENWRVWPDWDSPYWLYTEDARLFFYKKNKINRNNIDYSYESWEGLPEGDRKNFNSVYLLKDGSWQKWIDGSFVETSKPNWIKYHDK